MHSSVWLWSGLMTATDAMGQVAKDLLKEWTIYRMGTPAGTGPALGQPEAWAYVLKARAMSEQQTSFEQDAVQRSCSTIVEVWLPWLNPLLIPCWDKSVLLTIVLGAQAAAGDEEGHLTEEEEHVKAQFSEHLWEYSQAYRRLRERAGLRLVDGAVHTAHLGRPDGKACRDYHRQCHDWADKVGIHAGLACDPGCFRLCVFSSF